MIADMPDLVRTTTGTAPAVVTFLLPSFPIGVTIVTCTAIDGAGNTASSSFTVTVNSTGDLPPGGLPITGAAPLRSVLLAASLVLVGTALFGLRRRGTRQR